MKLRWFASALFVFALTGSMSAVPGVLLVADETSPLTQNSHADNDDLSRMHDTAMLRRFVNAGYLVSVPASSRHFYVHNIPAQFRYSRPWTRLFLTRLSRQFYTRFGHRLRVTSLVRTESRQRKLALINLNAAEASGNSRSSHLTGATLDISKRFMSRKEIHWMREVLYSLRTQDHIYAIEEFSQPTFHIMVYRNYPAYVTRLARKTNRTRPAPAGGPQVRSVSFHHKPSLTTSKD